MDQPQGRRPVWPADSPVSGAGFERVDGTLTCVLTRFQVRSIWHLFRFYRQFRRVRTEARKIGGLLHAGFLIEGPRTCFTFSVWEDEGAIVDFGGRVTSHVRVAGEAFGATYDRRKGAPQICSTQWRIEAVSNNLEWQGVDLASRVQKRAERPRQEPRREARREPREEPREDPREVAV